MKNNLYKIYFFVLVVLPIVLVLLPSDFFDKGETICLSVLLFDKQCYACGMTRAIQHLIHFDFSVAYAYNKLSFLVVPILIISYYSEIKRIFYKL